ncbi:MAG: N5-carboxyaminoimidazole ribonucleotide synthase [uncultured Gemmatimonadaceae bacterium]|uniref:N5-carboxyaminoimidazole ribonucleotide synthase n=1 Tax=uncultured Gemmatimonadaceae bacterium TaxID=246130 RepID=A0A6J4LZL8_9BACT|nr:MAG: N5-carboxyaminoimidazole ribonucleotide synthase [uncultured Gemmatimonadaceae bacterium]
MAPVEPGAALGFFGGGQLGRMTALAARAMGYDVRVLDPDPDCPARPVASHTITAALDDAAAAVELARGCGALTLEIERVSPACLEAASEFAPVRPGPGPIHVIQDRARQKTWLADHGFPVGPFRVARAAHECEAAVRALGPSIVKTSTGGYDGRGQARVERAEDAAAAWAALGAPACVVEQRLALDYEISLLVARRPGGAIAAYPPALNHHDAGVLTWSVLPAPVPTAVAVEARAVAVGIAEELGLEGLLAVELFVVNGAVLVNELAPRTHNSFHATERACLTSQFEQAVRAACDLPLGGVDVVRPGAIVNLLGDLWLGPTPPDAAAALAGGVSRLHLYGKRAARPGRKMGHVSTVGATVAEALQLAIEARERFAPGIAVASRVPEWVR